MSVLEPRMAKSIHGGLIWMTLGMSVDTGAFESDWKCEASSFPQTQCIPYGLGTSPHPHYSGMGLLGMPGLD